MSQSTISAEKPAAIINSGFIPVKEFHKMLSNNTASSYTSTFSFQPFLETIKKRSHSSCPIASAIFDTMEERLDMLPDTEELLKHRDALEAVAPLLFPALFTKGQMGFISLPFTKEFVFSTPSFKELLQSEDWEINPANLSGHSKARHGSLDAGSLVLSRIYGKEVDLTFNEIMRVRNRKTGLEKHLKINIILDFMEVKALKPIKKISDLQIYQLQNEWDNENLWHECIPPEDFSFEGIVVGHVVDVTDREILSAMESMMGREEGKVDFEDGLAYIQGLMRSFLGIPDLDFGSTYVGTEQWQESTTWSLLRCFDRDLMCPSFVDSEGAYGKAIMTKKTVTVGDLTAEEYLSPLEKALVEKGYRSLFLAPVFSKNGEVGGIMELASPLPFRFNQMTALKMKEMVVTYSTGMNKFVQEIDNKVRLTIQQQFTSIHPSVEWKFKNAATEFYWNKTAFNTSPPIRPIVFRDVYPLYGQADIVSSSSLRNKFIQADLIDNLQQVNKLMESCLKLIPFHLLDVYLQKTRTYLERLNAGKFVSSDETEIVNLLNREIHPLLHELKERFPQISPKFFDKYFDLLDSELGIIYNQRKDYEDSVNEVVEVISDYLEQENVKMQSVLPHFYEKYMTDGMEYNIYLGQSILEKGNFSPFFLKDFRLSQLLQMVEVTKLVAKKTLEMKVPLTTAQLIFVYNNSLSIRFRMGEKRFDVDGAYNVRYEILKKRIDKALIKGTTERLTQSGKIAIVYLQENDKLEYLEYLEYLADQGLITDNIEDLELEKLQGADGLRALRVTVN